MKASWQNVNHKLHGKPLSPEDKGKKNFFALSSVAEVPSPGDISDRTSQKLTLSDRGGGWLNQKCNRGVEKDRIVFSSFLYSLSRFVLLSAEGKGYGTALEVESDPNVVTETSPR